MLKTLKYSRYNEMYADFQQDCTSFTRKVFPVQYNNK